MYLEGVFFSSYTLLNVRAYICMCAPTCSTHVFRRVGPMRIGLCVPPWVHVYIRVYELYVCVVNANLFEITWVTFARLRGYFLRSSLGFNLV